MILYTRSAIPCTLLTRCTFLRTVIALSMPPLEINHLPTLKIIDLYSVFIVHNYPSSPMESTQPIDLAKILVRSHVSVIFCGNYDKGIIRKYNSCLFISSTYCFKLLNDLWNIIVTNYISLCIKSWSISLSVVLNIEQIAIEPKVNIIRDPGVIA